MKKYINTVVISLLFYSQTLMAAPCQDSTQCKEVWSMTTNQPEYYNHGLSWIACNPTKDVQFANQTLILKYSHTTGYGENTCYARFNLASYFQQPAFHTHGYITATITISGTQSPDFLKQRIWPAFWIRGVGDWPVNGEIDMFEYMADVQQNVTHVNLHGGPVVNQDFPKSEVVTYKVPALEDFGNTHTYGMEWKKDPDPSNGYMLTFYIDNINQGVYYASPASGDLLDAAIIRGFTTGMQLIFDVDDIGSNKTPNIDAIKNLPALNYQMQISNLKAFSVN